MPDAEDDPHDSSPLQRTIPRTVVLSANTSWNILNFRRPLVEALIRAGHRVVIVAPEDEHSARLADLGAEFVPIEIASGSVSVTGDLALLKRYLAIMRRIAPDAYLGFTIKPNIYGSIAAHLTGARVINNVSGLGTAFIKESWLTKLASLLYRGAFFRSQTVFFQNSEDLELFVSRNLVRRHQAALLPGSGINLEWFRPPEDAAPARNEVRFLLVARLLWDKGVGEFVEAARMVTAEYPSARFKLLGLLGTDNRTAIHRDQLDNWLAEGVVEYLGATTDVRPHIADADCVVLPSYREGLPRALLEGSAMGKPVIGTDVPGCRDVVSHGETGYLCQVRSPEALAAAMKEIIKLSPVERHRMGQRARDRVEREFCETKVVDKYLEALSR